MIERSVFSRRRTNGPVARRSSSVASASLSRSMGRAKRSRNERAEPSSPGLSTCMIDHSSLSRFSTGVPVRAIRRRARSCPTALVCAAPGFLICWASSSTSRPQSTAASSVTSRVTSEYVVSTTSWPSSAALSRPAPWWVWTPSEGANRASSRSQLPRTDTGHTTSVEPSTGSASRVAMSCAVLPRPMSSARQAPRPSRPRNASQPVPRCW